MHLLFIFGITLISIIFIVKQAMFVWLEERRYTFLVLYFSLRLVDYCYSCLASYCGGGRDHMAV